MTSLNTLSASAAATALRNGELSSEALVSACLDRIDTREPDVQAWVAINRDAALAEARACDADFARGVVRGPMHGVPVGFKDIIETAALPTGYGSPIYASHQPAMDAACVALVRAAGGVVLGKTVTTEFAFVNPSRTRNPHNLAHTPGGSSSGSAAGVADMMVPIAFGTQTGGSIIRPSSFNGVCGYKPTFGSYSYAGIKVLAGSLCTLGTLAREVSDHALVRSAMLGSTDSITPLDTPPVIGLCETPWWDQADSNSRAAVEAGAKRLEAAGADVRLLELPEGFDELPELNRQIMTFEGLRCLAPEIAKAESDLSEKLKESMYASRTMSLDAYQAALRTRMLYQLAFDGLMNDYDALLVPSAPGEAPEGFATTGNSIFNAPWTTLGAPCITLPGFTGSTGLPVGYQLVGGRTDDDELLRVALFAESA